MKQQSQLFFLAAANLGLRWSEPYRIQTNIIETKNFMPETLAIYRFPDLCALGLDRLNHLTSKGETWMPALDLETHDRLNLIEAEEREIPMPKLLDDEDEEWDDEDEEWDDEDEEWDEDEDWDEDDEEWDEDEDWDEEDEDLDNEDPDDEDLDDED